MATSFQKIVNVLFCLMLGTSGRSSHCFFQPSTTPGTSSEGMTSPYNPFRHADTSDSGWDFANGPHWQDTYEPQPGMVMNASKFGNYMAGYMGTYHGGDLGYLVIGRAGGNVYANIDRKDGRWWNGGLFFSGDSEDDIRAIKRGNEDAIAQKYKDSVETGKALTDLIISEAKEAWGAFKDWLKGRDECKK